MKTVYPPKRIGQRSIFLAGTIDNGDSRDWQTELVNELNKHLDTVSPFEDFVFANPRRPDWNTNWHGDHPELIKQIKWELNAMRYADSIFMWFEPNSKSPVTMLELGLFAGTNKLIVGCPTEFYRHQNIATTVSWARTNFLSDIEFALDWDGFVKRCKRRINRDYTDAD